MIPTEEEDDYIYIEWNKKFELGIPVIDAQHKKLVTLCNTLYQALMKNKQVGIPAWEKSLTDALQECAAYVQTHFHDEEVLMAAAGYPGLEEHKKAHAEFVRRVLETVKGFDKASFSTAFQFVKFLYDWILRHIAHEDTLYVKPILEYYRTTKK